MRTTVTLSDSLLRKAKDLAYARGCSVSALLEEALRAYLLRAGEKRAPYTFDWKPFQGEGQPTVDIADRDQLYDAMAPPDEVRRRLEGAE